MDFKFANRQASYILKIEGKYSVICGDSGTGKTSLTRFATIMEDLPGNTPGILKPLPIYGNQDKIKLLLDVVENSIIIIDEDKYDGNTHELMHAIEHSPNYFIFCTREGANYIPYGVNTTFKLEGKWPHKRMVPMFNNQYLTRNVTRFDTVVTEDEGIGFKVLQACCSSKNVIPACGKSKIIGQLRNSQHSVVVVFDKCGIGSEYAGLLKLCEEFGHRLFDSTSFEWEVLSKVFPQYVVKYTDTKDMLFLSEESFYVQELSNLLKQLFGLGYHKNSKSILELLVHGKTKTENGYITLDLSARQRLYEEFRSRNHHGRDAVGTIHFD